MDPDSYEVTTESRIAMYEIEQSYFSEWNKHYEDLSDRLDKLREDTLELQKTARHGIDIIEEDHGRMILVFTTVTVIFLPLTFVAGFFGMNTNDIRNMDTSQWVYWAVALPLTFIMVCLAALVFGTVPEMTAAVSRWWARAVQHNPLRRVKIERERKDCLPVDESKFVEVWTWWRFKIRKGA